MSKPRSSDHQRSALFHVHDESFYRDLKRRNVVRLSLTYLLPIILLTVFFYVQYGTLESEGESLHLKSIAENQSKTLDLYLSERLVNLDNLIDDPEFEHPPSSLNMRNHLEKLVASSPAFVDLGYFDSSGIQTSYWGPFPSLEKRNYSAEQWYLDLKKSSVGYIITDIYLGFRQQPHFTIAVCRTVDGNHIVLRATLDPTKMYEYISSLEGAGEVNTMIVNKAGYYQVVTPHLGSPLQSSSIVPPLEPRLGVESASVAGVKLTYAYSWLRGADWALIVQFAAARNKSILSGVRLQVLGISALAVVLILFVIVGRAEKLVDLQRESDRTKAQLEHAAKLASVGELAAGIAHEINNPLAVISETAGLMKDLLNPEFGCTPQPGDLEKYLDEIHDSVFRCRDITRKLLGFVRKTDVSLKSLDINRLIDSVLGGFLTREMAVYNIEIVRRYSSNLPHIVSDSNQLQQVVLNMLNNAADAMEERAGKITITTSISGRFLSIAISDSGKGIKPEDIDKIFLPFFTTKEVGKGTGLGLSVSYGIIKNLGGQIEVQSKVGEGTTFVINLPIAGTETVV
jgi:two-component system NtrC family sensor kinase